jgi:hypothetical protein
MAARVSAGSTRISNAPVVAGNVVLVINDRGQINAYRVQPLAASAGNKKTAPETPPPTENK